MNKDDLILISVDDHICEPADMFDAHVPDKYREYAPRVVEEGGGVIQWWYGDVRGRQLGLNAVAGKPREFFNLEPLRYEHMRAGCYDVDERVRDMNAGGVLASLNFPNFTGFSGQVLNQGPDHTINGIMIRAYNDWHVDEWCGAHPGRFIPCGILPLFDVERAADEVRRLAAKGCHAVAFSENPEGLNMASVNTDYWDPLFAACCDVGTVLCTHVGSSSRAPMIASDAPASVGMSISSMNSTSTLMDPDLGRFLEAVSRPAVLADRGGHRLDPVLPRTRRACAHQSRRLDDGRVARGHGGAVRHLPPQHLVLLHQRSRGRCPDRQRRPAPP